MLDYRKKRMDTLSQTDESQMVETDEEDMYVSAVRYTPVLHGNHNQSTDCY